MTTDNKKNPIIIFHRPKTNAEESLANQQSFIESYAKHLPITTFDYISGDWLEAQEVTKFIIKNFDKLDDEVNKFIIIIQHSLSEEEFIRQYDLYSYFNLLKDIDRADLYLMDSEGKLYEEVKNISLKKPKEKN